MEVIINRLWWTYNNRRIDTLHIALLQQNLTGLGAQRFHFVLLDNLTSPQLLDLSVQIAVFAHSMQERFTLVTKFCLLFGGQSQSEARTTFFFFFFCESAASAKTFKYRKKLCANAVRSVFLYSNYLAVVEESWSVHGIGEKCSNNHEISAFCSPNKLLTRK
jgi:hypothetical protein